MSQEIIDFGSYPNDANADSVRTSFQKTQNNFTELYTVLNVGSVQTVIAGAGLDQDVQTGNVTLTANIANVTIQTGSSLVVGVTSNPTSNSATIGMGTTPFVIDVSNTITTSNVIATKLTGTLSTASQPNVTSLGTLTGLTSSGNIEAPIFKGNVIANTITADSFNAPSSNTRILYNKEGVMDGSSELTWDESTLSVIGNVSASNANLGNAVAANYFTGVLTTSSQPNITSVGTLLNANTSGNFSAAGNVIASTLKGNVEADTISANAYTAPVNSSTTELLYNKAGVMDGTSKLTWTDTTNVFAVTGNIITTNANLGNLVTANYFTGTLTSTNQPNISTVGSLTELSVVGTTNVGNLVTDGNITIQQKLTTLDLTATGNTTTANLIAANITAASFTGNGNGIHSLWGPSVLNVVANANYAAYAGHANMSNYAGNITIASQPNITAVGTLVNLTVEGNINATGNGVFDGKVIATNLIGEAGNLSNIQGSNVMGNVASANVSYYSNITEFLYSPTRFESGSYRLAFVSGNAGGIGNQRIQTNDYLNFEASTGVLAAPKLYAMFDMLAGNTETGNLVVTNLAQTQDILVLGNANVNGDVTGITFTANLVNTIDLTVDKNLVSNTGYFISSVQVDGYMTVNETITSNNSTIQSNLVVEQNSQTYNMTILGNASVGANLDTRKITVSNIANVGEINVSGRTTLTGNTIVGNISVTGTTGLITTVLSTGNVSTIGNITGNWMLTEGSKMQSTFSDLAEYYSADQKIDPATVVEFGGTHEVRICNSAASTKVAGVVSTDPAYAMNANIVAMFSTAIALQGRVPTKVVGPVHKGDMMVSAGNGQAMACSAPQVGTVIGKSLENFDGESGIIEIAVGRL